ncbi:uncharacterized protein LOC106870694 [Octopus bimaculoides]|uniref:MARVEL domain-containing protein n=1 Tax=Octopus bimaculoides TaxID=37653 RepID=A0A0L8HH31_OCTBM|nr:uncharacterized protein LOC106870694 [Octopus bimaculoides]XP_052827819.1 uncharacterized protein LOC106870694 [Octopus bimaculoides]|eukprot:XP_014772342.1 PREDICTED: uncharacterized protein LOC106870694 [Octopus bimaculoides]
MTTRFKYIAMTVTGALHLALGILCIIISIVGFIIRADKYSYYNYRYVEYFPNRRTAAGSFIISLWIIAVGITGIITGQKSNSYSKDQRMRIVYLVLSILSAAVLSLGGITAFAFQAIWFSNSDICVLFFFGLFLMVLELALAIVSSSFCCCCSGIEEIAVTTQGPGVCQSANTNVPQVVCSPDAVTPHMPPQYSAYPPYAVGAQMAPLYNASVPNVAEGAMYQKQ